MRRSESLGAFPNGAGRPAFRVPVSPAGARLRSMTRSLTRRLAF